MTAGMFTFDQLQFRYEPFPIGMARPLMDADLYREFVNEFPDADMFGDLSVVGSKYSLSEKTNRRNYHELVHTRPVWKELHHWIKSDAFLKDVLFVRTFNSWHSVRPMQGTGSSAMRRSLTINIEERH